jgi:hypothetical protein
MKQILANYSHRHVMATRVVSIREAAHGIPPGSLSTDIVNFLDREKTLA